jgi:hypothetical protein
MFREFLDRRPHIAESCTGLHFSRTRIQTFSRNPEKLSSLRGDFADGIGNASVSDPAIEERTDVDAYDVSLPKRPA